MENTKRSISLTGIAQISMMAAITYLATSILKVPTITGGYAHIGDSMVFIGVILLGRKKGLYSAAVGMFLADLLGGYLFYAPFTLVIKAVMALIVGLIAFRKDYNGKNIIANTIGFVAGGTWMITGYFFADWIITRFTIPGANSIGKAFAVACQGIISNVMQALVGIVIAIPVTILLTRNNFIDKFREY